MVENNGQVVRFVKAAQAHLQLQAPAKGCLPDPLTGSPDLLLHMISSADDKEVFSPAPCNQRAVKDLLQDIPVF